MHTRPAPLLILALILASALFLRADSPAFAQTATVSPQSETLVPYHGLHDSGVTITAGIDASVTTIPISDPTRLKVGQIVETQDASLEIMEITGLGPGLEMEVTRGAFGTSPDPHSSGTVLYADFTEVSVLVSDVGFRPTGATLAEALDASSLDDSHAFLAESIGTGETAININDATVVADATVVRFDGAEYVDVIPNESFMESTGRVAFCMQVFPRNKGNFVSYGCSTGCPGEPPCNDGPSGSEILAEVRLVADSEGTISLDLLDPPTAKLLEADEFQTPLLISEVLDGSVTVVESAPPPPGPSTTCDGTADIKMCIQPPTQTVGVGTEFSVYVVAQNVTNLGAFEFWLEWDPPSEEMVVDQVVRGYRKDDGTGWYRTNLSAAVDDTVTNLPVLSTAQLQDGYTALVSPLGNSEEMLIVGVNASSIDVIRGYNGTTPASHGLNAPIWAGPERILVQRASLPSPHSAPTQFRADLPALHVSDHTLLTASALQIDSEWFEVHEVPARTLHDTVRTLYTAINESQEQITVPGADSLFEKGWTLKVEDELMVVAETPTSATVEVVRGFFGSQAASHDLGTPIWAIFPETDTVRVSRGFQGTTIESHALDAPITDVDGLGDYGFTMDKSGTPDIVDFVWAADSFFLGQTGRTVGCDPPTLGIDDITLGCDTGGASLPLGPTGSGTLATVSVTGTDLLPFTPSQTINVSAVTLHDVTGDDLPAGGGSGSVRVVDCPDFNDDRSVDFVGDVLDVAKAALIPADQADIIDGQVDVNENGAIDGLDDRADVQLPLAAGGRDQVDIRDGGVDVDENGAVNTLDNLANVALPLVEGGWDQVDIMNGGVDVDENGALDTLDDLDNVALTSWPKLPGHDVNLDGTVDFVGDVIITAKIALMGVPPRCPLPPP